MANGGIQLTPSTISITKVGSRTVLTPKGPLTHQNSDELETKLNECFNQHRTEIILDFKTVSFMDSEVLELLVRMHESLTNQGSVLKIININDICRDILIATRLINVLHVYKNINAAIKSVS